MHVRSKALLKPLIPLKVVDPPGDVNVLGNVKSWVAMPWKVLFLEPVEPGFDHFLLVQPSSIYCSFLEVVARMKPGKQDSEE